MKGSFGLLDPGDMLKDRKQNLIRVQTPALGIHGQPQKLAKKRYLQQEVVAVE